MTRETANGRGAVPLVDETPFGSELMVRTTSLGHQLRETLLKGQHRKTQAAMSSEDVRTVHCQGPRREEPQRDANEIPEAFGLLTGETSVTDAYVMSGVVRRCSKHQ